MDTHLSVDEIRSFRARSRTPQELDQMDDHLHSCAPCYQAFLGELEKIFPIEFDLDELAGMQVWHLEGEELFAYIEGRMDEFDFECAILHLEECGSCRGKVSVAFEDRLTSPELNESTLGKESSTWRGWLSSYPLVSRARLRMAGVAMLLLLVAGLIIWVVLQSKPTTPQVVKVPSPQTPSPGHSTQQTLPSRPEQPPSSVDRNLGIAAGGKGPAAAAPKQYGPARLPAEIEEAMIAKDLHMPTAIETLDRTPSIAVRGSSSSIQSFNIVRPFATVISDDRPTFSWTALTGATSYTVAVYDAALHLVGTSQPLRATQWSMRDRLEAGVVYTWIVTALKDGQEIIAPAAPARAEFKILAKSEATKLNRITSRTVSNAVRGVLYAEVGLLDESENEFQCHLAKRPGDGSGSEFAKNSQAVA